VIEERLGLQVQQISPRIARQLGADEDAKGLVVALVDPTADAAQRGLQRGDILLSANYQALETPEDLEAAINQAASEGREALLLRIQRRGRPALYMPVRLRQP
jgi:serine protease Do